jgi:hypothetical protein
MPWAGPRVRRIDSSLSTSCTATPVGGGPDWPGLRYLTDTVRNLLPFLVRGGAVTPEQIDIDTLEERLRAEVVDRDGIQLLPPLVGAWTRV